MGFGGKSECTPLASLRLTLKITRGPSTMDLPAEYNYTSNFYAGPLGKTAMGFSAEEFDEWTTLELEGLDLFTVVVSLVHAEGSLTMPLAQGQGFNTAMFKNVTPKIVTQLNFTSVTPTYYIHETLTQLEVKLSDNSTWYIFVSPNPGFPHFPLWQDDPTTILADPLRRGYSNLQTPP